MSLERLHPRLAPAELYWAVLALPRHAGREAARLAFEEVLPVPLERVHAVARALADGRSLLCGVEVERGRRLVDSGALSLRPAALPDWLDVPVSAESIELLHAPLQPRAVVRLQRRVAMVLVALLVATALLLTVGLERRRIAAAGREREAVAAVAALAAEVAVGVAGADGLPPALRVSSALRRARQSAEAWRGALSASDAASVAADLLGVWPRTLECRTDLITVSGSGATISTRVADPECAQVLIDSLRSVPSLALEAPEVSVERDGVRVRLSVHHARSGP